MQFGLYAPIPMATVGSPEVAKAVTEALSPLPDGRLDAQFDLGVELLVAADGVGFDLVLFAERHLGNDLAAWVMASAIGSRLNRIRGKACGLARSRLPGAHGAQYRQRLVR